MFDSSNRQRMISLRMTDLEYNLLKAEYRKHGFSSVSDLARLAIRQFIETSEPKRDTETWLKNLEDRLATLESRLGVSKAGSARA